MSVTDPIADMLTRIRNANSIKIDFADIPSSGIKVEIAKILYEEGYIKNYEVQQEDGRSIIRIYLKYDKKKKGAITELKRISKPSLRVYAEKNKIPKVLRGLGIAILSTSKGVLTGENAKKNGVGGEVICYIW
jgi:small subunit ribosomal protein S8